MKLNETNIFFSDCGEQGDLQKWQREKMWNQTCTSLFPRFSSLSAVTQTVWIMDDEERIFPSHPPPFTLFAYVTQGHRAENSAAALIWCEIKSTLEQRCLLLGNSTLVILHPTIPPSSLQHHLHLFVQGYFSLHPSFWNMMMYMWL